MLSILQTILIYAIPILFAITIHEVAHGWVANKLGDSTARLLGRLTLNPLKHIDIVGTIIVPAVLYFTSGFIFGWAKPVPIGWRNLHSPRRDVALVASAGPFSNLLMAILWGLIIQLGIALSDATDGGIAHAMIEMGKIGIQINIVLLVLNLIPIPPLDGSRVVSSLLPPRWALYYGKIEPFGFVILIVLMLVGVLGEMIFPLVNIVGEGVLWLVGL